MMLTREQLEARLLDFVPHDYCKKHKTKNNMRTDELISETTAEVGPSIDGAAKNVETLIDRLRNAQVEINSLKEANMRLREQIISFSKWTGERLKDYVNEVEGPRPTLDSANFKSTIPNAPRW